MAADSIFLDAAIRIGARLTRQAVWHHGRCNWLGWSHAGARDGGRGVYRSFGADLYSGTSGIALFLAHLYQCTGETPFATAALGGLRQALSKLDEVPLKARTSFYTGDLGIACALEAGGRILERPEWVEQGLDLALAPWAERLALNGLDVIQGSAGAIAPLLDLFHRHGSQPGRGGLLRLARRHGDHLLAHGRRRFGGLAWPQIPGEAPPELTGFAHGAAGVSLALLELAHALGSGPGEPGEPYRQGALAGMKYERQLFDPAAGGTAGNWPDLRYGPASAGAEGGEPRFMIAWCHGAAGIGLARLRSLDLLGDDGEEQTTVRHEVDAALGTVVGQLARPAFAAPGGGGTADFSLCHGATGLAEFLLAAHRHLHNGALRVAAEEVGHFGIENFLVPDLPFPCGVGGGGETPGLLLGLAGIGHFYLRLATEDSSREVCPPSVLIMGSSRTATQKTKADRSTLGADPP
jgi:lantibiotic modifying enzyme